MLHIETIDEFILQQLRVILGKYEDDTSADHIIASMTAEEALNHWCESRGLDTDGRELIWRVRNILEAEKQGRLSSKSRKSNPVQS